MPIGPTQRSSALNSQTVEKLPFSEEPGSKPFTSPSLFDLGYGEVSWGLAFCALLSSLALIVSIGHSSLWTDEAFSAWLASHRSLHSFGESLFRGDSSDLQMGLYYLYLFGWVRLFGMSEYALRAANIPFILLFNFALVWMSWRVFKSRGAWIVASVLPFVWYYSSDARSYMAVLAFSSAGFASMLGFIGAPSPSQARKFPWLALICLLLGSLFHMLFLLAVPPMLVILAFAYSSNPSDPRWRLWLAPIAWLSVPLAALAVFFVFTFSRGHVDYIYPLPGFRQMASVVYELAGFSNFGPNRKLVLDFGAYKVPLALGAGAILAGAVAGALSAWQNRRDKALTALVAAAFLSCAEVVALSWATGKQLDARHLSGVVPVFLLVLLAVFRRPHGRPVLCVTSMVLLGCAWLAADLRGKLVPAYQNEDYRDAVKTTQSIRNRTGGEILLASDPVAPAYYGLGVQGPAPCYPIVFDCAHAFTKVPWRQDTPALDASQWTLDQINDWLARKRESGTPVVILHQLVRSRRNWPWTGALNDLQDAPRGYVHGFEIVVSEAASHR